MFGQSVFWRESMKPAKFLVFDGRVVLVLIPAFMHLRFWTLVVAMLTMGVFWWFDRKGISADSILRFLRSKLIGSKRTARGVFEERTPVDFGFEPAAYLARVEREASMSANNGEKKSLLDRISFGPKVKGNTDRNPITSMPKEDGLNLKKDNHDG